MQSPQQMPTTAYASFAGVLDTETLHRIFGNLAAAPKRGVKEIHLLFHSTGGIVADSVCLYNFFRALPFDLHLYNAGSVASGALIAFVGAKHRYASRHGTFLLHKANHSLLMPNQATGHRAIADNLEIADARCEAILRETTQIAAKKWKLYKAGADVEITASEALQYGIVSAIREFQPPASGPLFHF